MGFFIFLLVMRSKKKKEQRIPLFAAYYAQKRQEFPWLDNWLKENGDPSVKRATEFLAEKDPGKGEPEYGLTMECPSCGCPHSWVMTQKETIVERGEEKIQETTTTIKGGGQDWGFGAGDATYSRSKTTGYVFYGKSIKDFKCLNCGHTEQNEYDEQWNTHDVMELGSRIRTFDPPISAWGYYGYDADRNARTTAANEAYKQTKAAEGTNAARSNDQSGIPEAMLKAAEMGSEEAQKDIAVKYLLGHGVEADEGQSAFWLEKWWRQENEGDFNFAEALYELADSYQFSNPAIAVALFEEWVERCDDDDEHYWLGFEKLGEFYRDGKGVSVDIEKARHWYEKAVEMGSSDAKKALKKLK